MVDQMRPIEFFVPGNPKGLKRHRTFRTKTGHMVQVDASKSDKADFLAMAARYRPDVPMTGPVSLCIVAVFQRPKSHYRAGKHAGELRPDAPKWYVSAPDCSNCLKLVEDALNGIFWKDDRQIAFATIVSIYGECPGVAVEVRAPADSEFDHAFHWAEMVRASGRQ